MIEGPRSSTRLESELLRFQDHLKTAQVQAAKNTAGTTSATKFTQFVLRMHSRWVWLMFGGVFFVAVLVHRRSPIAAEIALLLWFILLAVVILVYALTAVDVLRNERFLPGHYWDEWACRLVELCTNKEHPLNDPAYCFAIALHERKIMLSRLVWMLTLGAGTLALVLGQEWAVAIVKQRTGDSALEVAFVVAAVVVGVAGTAMTGVRQLESLELSFRYHLEKATKSGLTSPAGLQTNGGGHASPVEPEA